MRDWLIAAGAVVIAILLYIVSRRGRKIGELYYEVQSNKYKDIIDEKFGDLENEKLRLLHLNDTYTNLRDKYIESRTKYHERRNKRLQGGTGAV